MSSQSPNCQNCKKPFSIEPEDFVFYEKMNVPPPTWCPDCRFMRRLHWRNERALFHNVCKKCSKKIISVYPPDSSVVVYCRPCWWSDDWDGIDYGIDFDPNKPFFEQMRELLYRVPLPDLFGLYTTLENSEYTNMVGYLKNCYFLTMADWNENCSYGSNVFHCKDSLDCLMLYESELCYETVNCYKCYKTMFSVDCENCTNVYFSKNCVGCSDCIGCANLNNKQYCLFNVQYSPAEYKVRAQEYLPTSRTVIKRTRELTEKFLHTLPNKYIHERNSQDVSGDYIYDSNKTYDSFIVQDMENARYCAFVLPGKTTDCYDHTHYGSDTSRMIETLQCGNQASNIRFSWFTIIDVMNVEYGIFNIGANDCFGSVGIKKKQYCILNKQYTKDAYEKLRSEIRTQMNELPYMDSRGVVYRYGEFFPIDMSPFEYNISGAQEFFPLTEELARKQGLRWRSHESSSQKITLKTESIPDAYDTIPNSILEQIIECRHMDGECAELCSGAFKVLSRDLTFYRQMKLPLPSLCPNCRHYRRILRRNQHKLVKRRCKCEQDGHAHHTGHCPVEFKTTYSSEKPDVVYCKKCYRAEVV